MEITNQEVCSATQELKEEDSLVKNQHLVEVSLEASLPKHQQVVEFLETLVDLQWEEEQESLEVKLNKLKEVVSLEVKSHLPLEEHQLIQEVVFLEEHKHQEEQVYLEVASHQVLEEEHLLEDQYSIKPNQQQVFLEEDRLKVVDFNQHQHGVVIKEQVDFLNPLQ